MVGEGGGGGRFSKKLGFDNVILGIQLFYICPYFPLNIVRVFFYFFDFLAESPKANKN